MIKNSTMQFVLIGLLVVLSACEGYHMPSLTNENPAGMSDQTLCYRYATAAERSEGLAGEINRRHLDCSAILANDPLLSNQRY